MCRSFSNKVEWVNKVEASLRTSSHNMTPPMAQLPEASANGARLTCYHHEIDYGEAPEMHID